MDVSSKEIEESSNHPTRLIEPKFPEYWNTENNNFIEEEFYYDQNFAKNDDFDQNFAENEK